MKRLTPVLIAGAVLAAAGITVNGSSHREALSVLNEPCADNTDTYAWVSDGAHDKLYLISIWRSGSRISSRTDSITCCSCSGSSS